MSFLQLQHGWALLLLSVSLTREKTPPSFHLRSLETITIKFHNNGFWILSYLMCSKKGSTGCVLVIQYVCHDACAHYLFVHSVIS